MEKKMKLMQCMADIPSQARRLFTVIIMMVASVLCTEAQTLINGLYYNLDSETNTASVAKNPSASGNIVIPSIVENNGISYSVTSINEQAFSLCSNLTSITIPTSLKNIGYKAFYGCKNLTQIEIPNSVTNIESYAFYNSGLTSVEIPNSVKSIENYTFASCSGLSSIIIPNSIESIGDGVFSWCTGLTSILIPNSVKNLGNRTFVNCSNLKSVEFPQLITYIGDYTFSKCTSLSSIKIPNLVKNIGTGAFSDCSNLSSIEIPATLTNIEKLAFYDCSSITQLICRSNIPPTVDVDCFIHFDKSIPLYVPASSIEAYKAADYWSEFTNFQPIAEPAKTEWRISDRTDIDVDFHSINEAMDDERVQDGHTLYIERGTNLGDEKITKSVNVVGPGYDLSDDSKNAKVDFLIINEENVKVVGLQIQNALVCNNNVNIENCYITNSVLGNETSYENDNCVIKSCFIDGNVYGRGEDGTYEWTLTNNIIKGGVYNFEEMTLNHNTIVSANYVLNGVNFSTVTNNLLHQTKSDSPIVNCSDNEYDKNVVSLASNTYGEKSNQTLEKSISCSGDANSEDYYTPVGYTLGYSTDGTDCGAFGGSNPYVKGGKSGLFVEREGEEEPEPEPEPTYPETPIVKGQLDNTATLDIENDVYNSLGEFLKALSIRGIKAGTDIAVANQQFDIALDDESYGYIQTSAVALELSKAYIYMKASNNAIFNITLSPAFAAAHVSDVQTVVATIMGFANHIITTNIKILINGTLYQYTGFQVEPNDLLDLKNLYTALNGENWTNVKWSFLSNGRLASDFPGVTFTEPNELGQSYVKELDLVKNNMKGDVSNLTLYFPQLTSLNMYYNQLTGDVTNMVSNLGNLKTLDISYNMLTGLTRLPSSVATLNKGNQFRSDYNQEYLSKLSAAMVYISDKQSVGLPTIMTYDLKTNSNVPTAMYISERSTSSLSAYYGQLVPHGGGSTSYYTSWTSKPFTYEYAQDHEIYLRSDDDTIYPAILKYEAGDANMSGYTDLLDVQTTISKVLSPGVVSLFNKTAANTYNDEIINVQDVVCTVNIVLGKPIVSIEIPTETGNHYDQPTLASRRATPVPGGTGNILFVEGERLWLTNETEVGAIEVELRGLSADEVSLALNRKDFQMASLDIEGGSRHIIYSLSGKSVPVGTAAILRLSNDYAEVADAALSTVDAKSLSFTIGATPTGINTVDSSDMLNAMFEGNGIVISSSREISNAEVVVTSASGINTLTWKGECIKAGETIIEANLSRGIYIIGIYENGKRIGNVKLIKK